MPPTDDAPKPCDCRSPSCARCNPALAEFQGFEAHDDPSPEASGDNVSPGAPDDVADEAPAAWKSPWRMKPAAWKEIRIALGLTEADVAPRAAVGRPSAARARGSWATAPADEMHAGDPWYHALRAAGRLGKPLGDGRYAVLCVNDHAHTTPPPDGSAENASGSCVLLPPMNGSRFGRPFCAHGHCREAFSLKDWAVALGVDLFAEAWALAMGWRYAEGYVLTPHGVFEAKKRALRLPDQPPGRRDVPAPAAGGDLSPGAPDDAPPVGPDPEAEDGAAPRDEPFWWGMGERLCNFPARIVANLTEHDDAGARHLYDIEAGAGEPQRLRVVTSEFPSLGWVSRLGSDAVIEPGRDTKDRLRAAIQHLSRPAPRRDVFAVTGWRDVGGRPLYLHPGGAIGAEGMVQGVEVRLDDPALARFAMPAPLEGEPLRRAVEACAALFLLPAPEVVVPLFGAVWRAPLGPSPLTVYVSGVQGSGKTLLTALAQQHFGPAMHEAALPASLKQSTPASLNKLRAIVGDAVFAVDDFLISGTADDLKLNERVDQLVRAQYGGTGARRLARDGSLARSESAPRSTLILTGETLPRVQSLLSRLAIGEVAGPLAVDLTPHKGLARGGLYAGAMAAYLRWLAPELRATQAALPGDALRVVEKLAGGGARRDPRTLALLAEVGVGVGHFLRFAESLGAAPRILGEVREVAWSTLKASTERQRSHQDTQDPALRFLSLLADGIRGNQWYFTRPDGTAPADPGSWGWFVPNSRPAGQAEDGQEIEPLYVNRGACLGVVDGGEVWVNPKVAFAEVQKLARALNDPLAVSLEDLPRRLHDRGALTRTDINKPHRRTYLHRKRLTGTGYLNGLCMDAATVQTGSVGGGVSTPAAVTEAFDTGKSN